MTSRTSDLLFDESFSFPGELRRAGDAGPARVAVIGAGASGLAAAYELQRHGLDVTVYERTARPGGRVRTWRFWDGAHGELGAMRIPGNHHCTLHYVDEFGLATRPFVNTNPDAYYLLRGRRVRRRGGGQRRHRAPVVAAPGTVGRDRHRGVSAGVQRGRGAHHGHRVGHPHRAVAVLDRAAGAADR
ncbi:FAD-dependent oxidoreductase [Nocardia beijingensis]|uniref:FAD-dependent oxidoreductase n=1 Tax=Nocardia beijingensis TaxID=95162 RepID=UPI001FD4DF8A|nr:FAD-dependent oxidoreductase [Nocardia beijingensis]